MLRARDRKRTRRRARRHDDLVSGVASTADFDFARTREARLPAHQVDPAVDEALLELFRHAIDEGPLALDEPWPVQRRWANRDLMRPGPGDFIECLSGRNEDLLRDAPAKRAHSSHIAPFDHQRSLFRCPSRSSRSEACVSRSQNQDVVVSEHRALLFAGRGLGASANAARSTTNFYWSTWCRRSAGVRSGCGPSIRSGRHIGTTDSAKSLRTSRSG